LFARSATRPSRETSISKAMSGVILETGLSLARLAGRPLLGLMTAEDMRRYTQGEDIDIEAEGLNSKFYVVI